MARRLISVVVLILLAFLLTRTFCFRGLVFPVRVLGGSMAPTLLGEHWLIRCPRCGFEFACGTETPPRDSLAICPNCGEGGIDIGSATLIAGQRVGIDLASYAIRPIRRWETVAITVPAPNARWSVKRVVGLPTENVQVVQGDIYVNDQIARRPWQKLVDMSIPVHEYDGSFNSHGAMGNRWVPEDDESNWSQQAAQYILEMASESVPAPDMPGSASSDRSLDWLVYRNVNSFSGSNRVGHESPIVDHYAYNQGASRTLNEVGDLIFVCEGKLAGSGTFGIRIHDGWQWWEILWRTNLGSVELFRDGRLLVTEMRPKSQPAAFVQLMVAACDHQLRLFINTEDVLLFSYDVSKPEKRAIARPLAVGGRGVDIELSRLSVRRDIYYTDSLGSLSQQAKNVLRENEYFVLGDNSPISMDGRQSQELAHVDRSSIIGRVVKIR